MKDIITLGIESSCDETSVAVVKNGREILSNIIDTQIPIHEKYGGVVPEIASRNHIEAISRVTKKALEEAKITFDEIDAVTPTYGPGLVGALLVGVSYAKALSFAINKPLVGVNHIQGHIAANYITYKELEPPFLCVLISGGNTQIVNVKSYIEFEILGKTRDDAIGEALANLHPDTLMIGFARRFATYKRATLIFKDLERITQILNEAGKPVQIIFAGKAHPSDNGGKDLIRYIHELSMKPQFKGKIFLLENYNIGISKYLVSGVDVWLNNPRRPMEASGTSGQKAAVNGVINFSVLDGWWAEGYNQKNGWTIGTNAEYSSYEEQDNADSESIYQTLENKIIPTFFDKDENGISKRWMEIMKQSIMSNAGRYSTARMLIDYTNKFYMPLCNLYNKYYTDLSSVAEFNSWKNNLYSNWNDITIKQEKGNLDNITVDAGNNITVRCKVYLPNIDKNSIEAQVYYGQIMENGIVDKIQIIPMNLIGSDDEKKEYEYEATVELTTGGNYGYTFRVMPKNEMLLDPANLDLVKWITK